MILNVLASLRILVYISGILLEHVKHDHRAGYVEHSPNFVALELGHHLNTARSQFDSPRSRVILRCSSAMERQEGATEQVFATGETRGQGEASSYSPTRPGNHKRPLLGTRVVIVFRNFEPRQVFGRLPLARAVTACHHVPAPSHVSSLGSRDVGQSFHQDLQE